MPSKAEMVNCIPRHSGYWKDAGEAALKLRAVQDAGGIYFHYFGVFAASLGVRNDRGPARLAQY